ncbi:hypothetical protein ACJ73_08178 [Blastomyces percursus]|uniref:Uncharacterized protein n=1 Tax=Blastomyces percursus TaxID=1658174 RepID=A0A1J9PVT7_9EURO|nr:hypothetical protein ACJ73_08178 [Blastomyces percursus]
MAPRTNTTSCPGSTRTALYCGLWGKGVQLLTSDEEGAIGTLGTIEAKKRESPISYYEGGDD